jgi:hypothetical protein
VAAVAPEVLGLAGAAVLDSALGVQHVVDLLVQLGRDDLPLVEEGAVVSDLLALLGADVDPLMLRQHLLVVADTVEAALVHTNRNTIVAPYGLEVSRFLAVEQLHREVDRLPEVALRVGAGLCLQEARLPRTTRWGSRSHRP